MRGYDVVVIGGGTAGSNAARAAAGEGARVLMIHASERMNLCIEAGCMPSKSLLAASERIAHARNLEAFGGSLPQAPKVDLPAILARKDAHVARFYAALKEGHAKEDFEILVGRASFLPDERGLAVETAEGRRVVKGDRYVIAAGTEPFVPPIPGIERVPYVTSDNIMENAITEIPEHLMVLGAGAIGLEFATFFAGLGSRVTVVDRGGLLGRADPEFGEELARLLREQHIEVRTQTTVANVAQTAEGVSLSLSDKEGTNETCTGDTLLVATGRRPCVRSLALEHVGLTPGKGEALALDETMQTRDPSVYAAGDVTGALQILHVAAAEGRTAGANAAHGEPRLRVDYDALRLLVIFTDPPFAQLGLTEQEAKEQGCSYAVHTIAFAETGRAITMGATGGLWKLLVDRESGRVLGSQILGPAADELIHQVHLLRHLGIPLQQLDTYFAYHPTLSEQLVSLVRTLRAQLS